jgi:hypothetical protein
MVSALNHIPSMGFIHECKSKITVRQSYAYYKDSGHDYGCTVVCSSE